MYDKNISPVGWYIGSYLIRFIELNDPDKNDSEKRFLSEDGSEIMWAEYRPRKLKNLRKLVRKRDKFSQ
jgi:hypothetical protein